MTVTTTNTETSVAGDGATTVFNFNFIAVAASDLKITYTSPQGIVQVLSPVAYSVTINNPPPGQLWGIGGTVTYPLVGPPMVVGAFLLIERVLPLIQDVSLKNQATLLQDKIEQALDKIVLEMQGVEAAIGRALLAPDSDPDGLNYTAPDVATRSNTVMAWDAAGNVTVNTGGTPPAVPVSPYMKTLLTSASATALLQAILYTAAGLGAVARQLYAKLADFTAVADYDTQNHAIAAAGTGPILYANGDLDANLTTSTDLVQLRYSQRFNELYDVAGVQSGGVGGAYTFSERAQYILPPFRGTMATLATNNPSIPNNTPTAVPWDQTDWDTESSWSVTNPTRLTIPQGVNRVTLKANINFGVNAIGVRIAYFQKNGASFPGMAWISQNADAGGGTTLLNLVSSEVPCNGGDIFECFVNQSSGGALPVVLDATSWFSFTVENILTPLTWGQSMCVYEGDYSLVPGGINAVATGLSVYDVVVLSHITTFNFANGCSDSGYPNIVRLIMKLRVLNPKIRIFGYVPATADAPNGSGCGQSPPSVWNCPGGVCSNMIAWVNAWTLLMPAAAQVDGIFFDLVSNSATSGYITAAVRDDCFQYAKSLGMTIMANSTVPDPSGLNFLFAGQSPYISSGDYIMIEGFNVDLGVSTLTNTSDTLTFGLAPLRAKGIRLAALATEAVASPGGVVNCASVNGINSKALFNSFFVPGDVYQYTTGDLGTTANVIPPRCI